MNRHYRIHPFKTLLLKFLQCFPPVCRERLAERFLRRKYAPGPAAEHVFQYLLSIRRVNRRNRLATVAKAADHFYQTQYRQYLNATMGAFAMTATQILLGSGGALQGRFDKRHRKTFAAMLDQMHATPPILVVDHQTVAVPLLLPKPENMAEQTVLERWLSGYGAMPEFCRTIMMGKVVSSADSSILARERSAVGAILEIIDAILISRRLAILAMNPHNPDAMALHITLFGTELVAPEQLRTEHGLESSAMDRYHDLAQRTERYLTFAIGVTEEVFTQCSQNLFVKLPVSLLSGQVFSERPWNPSLPLEQLMRSQFEILQVTVSASGLPGVSPRNGDSGKAAFVGRLGKKPVILIPYHPGNAVHGHAAKLWSNAYGTLVVSDDHTHLGRIMLSGSAKTKSHAWIMQNFPTIAAEVANQKGRKGFPIERPEYWFLHEIAELVQQVEPLAANILEPSRAACTISAGGQALHGKKPGYFKADSLPPYDQHLQHKREQAGRIADPEGLHHRKWLETVSGALNERLAS